MAENIFPTYGIALTVIQSDAQGVELDGITEIFQNAEVPAFITDIDFEDSDVILPIVALDDKRVLYSFGKNFGKATISGLIYLFNCRAGSLIAQRLYEAFNKVRSSAKSTPSNLSIVGGISGIKVYPISLRFANADAKNQSIGFSISCVVAPITNG